MPPDSQLSGNKTMTKTSNKAINEIPFHEIMNSIEEGTGSSSFRTPSSRSLKTPTNNNIKTSDEGGDVGPVESTGSISLEDLAFASSEFEDNIDEDDEEDHFDDDSRKQFEADENKSRKGKGRDESLKQGGGDLSNEEQTLRVLQMKRRFYCSTILSALAGFLLTFFLLKGSVQPASAAPETWQETVEDVAQDLEETLQQNQETAVWEWDDDEETINPSWSAVISPLLMLFANLVMFYYYERAVEDRHESVSMHAERTGQIISSLFPKNVQRRIWEEAHQEKDNNHMRHDSTSFSTVPSTPTGTGKSSSSTAFLHKSFSNNLSEFLDDDMERKSSLGLSKQPSSKPESSTSLAVSASMPKTRPIADLFPEATIFFGDLVGFTAWSSMREPSQVFVLLETIYGEFDELARRRRVFKVETVGDCYVAGK